MKSPAEHEAFAKFTHHLKLAIESLKDVAELRQDQPWNQVVGMLQNMYEKVMDLAERGIKRNAN